MLASQQAKCLTFPALVLANPTENAPHCAGVCHGLHALLVESPDTLPSNFSIFILLRRVLCRRGFTSSPALLLDENTKYDEINRTENVVPDLAQ